ncbi:RNF213 [Symbiodinium necroappetens]|uniref:RNF213 protein n=1 Tax=Symbiodinium necroappetens TaxID=1628268 RepID=A0A812XT81_9DINO|nr:RNF213 [Symbiodinium necroappetens]
MAVGQVSEDWPDLPAASAIAGLQGGASPAFSQVPSTLLVVSPALSLLGKSSAFRALWSHEGCGAGRFEPSELQLSAIAWAGFYSSLQAPEASELPLLALELVLGRLQDAEELRLMAVTGSTLQLSDGKIVAWGTSDPSAEWEAAATDLARKLWHSLSVKRCHSALQQTLWGLREKLLDEKTGQKELRSKAKILSPRLGAFQSWETTALKNHGPIGALTAQIDARLLIHPEAVMTSMLNSFEMLQWLRKMPDDSDYLVRIEVALNRSEMEVPVELWLAAEGRVDESKLSALTAVRTTLHDLIYRAKSRFSTLDALLESLSGLEHSTEISGLVDALDFAFSLLGPLSELLGGKDAALARMLQMLKPTSCARWVLCYPRLAAPSPADDKAQEEEEETLAQTPAEARMLYLMLSSPDAAQASAPQRLVEILDFQASVTLAASTFDAAFGQVRMFNEQIGLVRLAAAVLDDLRVAGHPDYQTRPPPPMPHMDEPHVKEIHVEWHVARGRGVLSTFGNWRQNLINAQQTFPAFRLQKKPWRVVLGFFAARQLGCLLNAVSHDLRERAQEVLAAVASTWLWQSQAEAWSSDLLKRCRLQTGAEDAAALLQQDSQNLETLASALQATWMQHGAERVVRAPAAASDAGEVLGQLGPGAHVALATDFYSAVALLLWPFLARRLRPAAWEVLPCHVRTTPESVQLLLLRWAHCQPGQFFGLLLPAEAAFATQQIVVQAVHDAVDEAGPLPSPSCPLLILVCGENAAQAHVSTQLMQHRVEASQPPAHEFADKVVQLISAGDAAGPSVHVGPHCGCGKTFSVRMSAKEQGASYRQLKLTAALGFGALGRSLCGAVEGVQGPVLLHLDLTAGLPLLSSESFAAALFELIVLGRVARMGADRADGIFKLDSRVRVAIELPAGVEQPETAPWRCGPLLSWLPRVSSTVKAEAFCADEASLQAGLGDSFAAARHDGLRNPDAVATAYHRLQYVCGALAIVRRLGGAFPLHYEGADSELGGEECFSLLVEFAKLKLRPSLWNIWSFVDVLYWQLKEVHHPESVANQACIPEEGAPQAKPMSELLAQDCPMFKGELVAFILRTARDFATRQTANNEVDPETVVAAHLQNFHQDRFCGTWRLQPFSSDGHPVFAKYDKSEKGSGQFFLYYRAAQRMWVIDAELDKVAPAFAYTRKRDYDKGWWRMASWVPNKGMTVVKAEHPLAFEKDAVEVRGVDEQLTGSPEEYLVPLNGMYLRQPKDENVNGYQHFVLEKPRRHLFWDKGMDTWCIAHVCHSDEGVYAKSSRASLCGPYVTMGRDEQVPNARVSFVTAGQESASTRREPQQDEDFPLLRWENSSHDCMLFSNRKHQVCFLSSQPTKLRISMHPGLLFLLERNHVSVGESLDALTADHTKILGCLTGVDRSREEAAQLLDGKYCLTGDAVLKMLAIFVRLRCGLPVILMGECGCGKTELVRYLCAWLAVELVTLNVHGGTTEDDIDRAFAQARKLVQEREGERVIIFLDEINTSQHVNMLCEAVLERSLRGDVLPSNVDVLAALNPRRKRPQQQLTTGLVFGGQGSAEEEMSGLVYRVHAVPETVNDFLFDFGALTQKAEKMYVRSMVQNGWPESHEREQELVTELLCLAQAFIRWEEGDPSAVSLRDVKRCLRVARWTQERFGKKTAKSHPHPPSVVVAVALVYHYRLASRDSRHSLWIDLTRRAPWPGDRGEMKGSGWAELSKQREENGLTAMENILRKVQNNVAKEFEVEKDVVMNEALAENVFVGLLCIMNRIPLFIVGKPGTSKTLCMQVLMSNLQGKLSKSKFLQTLPALRLMQYQCSPLSTADGIQRQFDAASRFASNALDAQVVLLLDEVGLAEFSPDMPLKVLHGILAEPGIVSVVGLSNWRLDPAKMNRSVCLARPDPDSAEVGRTGAGLLAAFSGSSSPDWLKELSAAFWSVFADQGDRDWLGMRDYYSFVRAVRDGCLSASVEQPTAEILAFAIRRNFGGQPVLLERLLHAMLPAGARREGERLSWPLKELLRISRFHPGCCLAMAAGRPAALHGLSKQD